MECTMWVILMLLFSLPTSISQTEDTSFIPPTTDEMDPCLGNPCGENAECHWHGAGLVTCVEYEYRDPCLDDPCEENAECSPYDGGYLCISYRDPCLDDPCDENAGCSSLSNGGYTCISVEEEMDPRLENPCDENAECQWFKPGFFACRAPEITVYAAPETRNILKEMDPRLENPCDENAECQWFKPGFFACRAPEITVYAAPQTRNIILFCEESFLNDSLAGPLTFSPTWVNSTADSVERCPSYSTMAGQPRATRACLGDNASMSYWNEQVVINNCFQGGEPHRGLQNLTHHLEDNPLIAGHVSSVSRDVADITGSGDLTGQDLDNVADLLEMITGSNSSSSNVTSNVVEIVDNILDLQENTYEESLPEEALIRVLKYLEAQLNNLQGGDKEVNFTDVRAFVGAVARDLDASEFGEPITFGILFRAGRNDTQENLNESNILLLRGEEGYVPDDVKATITLPRGLLNDTRYANSDRVPVTFIIHRTSHLFMNQRVLRSNKLQVESLIISATVEGERIEGLRERVVTKFRLFPLEVVTNRSSRDCYFWDFSLLNGSGNWSTEGCQLVSGPRTGAADEDELVGCHCNHLTNFAILLDVQGDIDSLPLDILSIIGCIVSIVALIIAIITFLGVKKFRSQRPKQILVQLCFALLGLYLTFLIGINQTNLEIGCIVFGALIHMFCLAAVSWMTVEAVNMYLVFVKVFESGITSFMWKASVAAWGGPLIVVVVSVIVRSEHYTGEYCFVQAGTMTFYVGLFAIVAALLLGNLVTFTLVIHQLSCGREKVAGRNRSIRDEALRYIAISVLLGLTWIFGCLAIGDARFVFNLLFLVLNSLQGFFVFVLFCLRQPEVREVWLRWLQCCPASGPYSTGGTVPGPSKAAVIPRRALKNTPTKPESLQMSSINQSANPVAIV